MARDEYRERLETMRAAVADALEIVGLPPGHLPKLMVMSLQLRTMLDDAARHRRLLDEAVSASAREGRTCHRGIYID